MLLNKIIYKIMPKPTSKKELVALSHKNFKKLNDYIDTFSKEEQNDLFTGNTMNRNIRDVLAHVHHWHLLFLDWYSVGMSGEKPDMPAKGYTWKTNSALNKWIWKQYQNVKLEEIRKRINHSHNEVQQLIQQHANNELFEKKRYKWTGSTSLGAYLISATSSHYDWAYKLIKREKK